jgi:hypothetical protein
MAGTCGREQRIAGMNGACGGYELRRRSGLEQEPDAPRNLPVEDLQA